MTLILAAMAPGEPEIFASLQGEGASAGRACIFLRLSGCNLACRWCDTAYTWHFTGDGRPHDDAITYDRAANQVRLGVAETAARIAALGRERRIERLVVTGGEPLLQAGALGRMLALLDGAGNTDDGWRIEVETNGTITPPGPLLTHIDQWNISPKLAHGGNPRELAIREDVLARFAPLPHAFFKFTIARADDIAEVRALAGRYAIPPGRIFLMPEGRTSQQIHTRGRWLADIAAQEGFNFSDRLHIHLFGDTRGT